MEADLEEKTRKYSNNTGAEFTLIINNQRIELGKCLKDCAGDAVPGYRKPLQETAEKLGINRDPPTPSFLQYFSSRQIRDDVINGKKYNIHPVAEKIMVRKILEELAKTDPSIAGEGQQRLTKIGGKELNKLEFARLKKIYRIFAQ